MAWTQELGLTEVKATGASNELELTEHVAQSPPRARLERIPIAFAVDVITRVLWHHRQMHGALPPLLARFADLFDVTSS
jgi:hypothetical protein